MFTIGIKIKTESLVTYNNYLNRIQSDSLLHPKLFWNFVRSRKRGNFIRQTMSLNNTSSNFGQDFAYNFGNYFISVYSPNINTHISTSSSYQNTEDLNT